jgi:hypothetical protein
MDWFVALPGGAYIQVANLTAGTRTGKAYLIKDIIRGRFYYPREPGKLLPHCEWGININVVKPKDGTGEISDTPRALREGEIGEWILLNGVSPGLSSMICVHSQTTTDRRQRRVLISDCTIYILARSTSWYVVLAFCCDPRTLRISLH